MSTCLSVHMYLFVFNNAMIDVLLCTYSPPALRVESAVMPELALSYLQVQANCVPIRQSARTIKLANILLNALVCGCVNYI